MSKLNKKITNNYEDEQEHSEMGASGAPVWIHCNGSIFLKRQAPKDHSDNDIADKGTELHNLASKRLLQFLLHKEEGTPYQTAKDFYDGDTNPEDIDLIEDYVHDCFYGAMEGSVTGKVWWVEEKLFYSDSLKLFGTPDFACAYKGDKGEIIIAIRDFKTGYKIRDPKKDEQLGCYLLYVRELLKSRGKTISYGRAAFFQRSLDQQLPEFRWTNNQLDLLEKKILKVAHQTYVEKKAKFKVGPWCEMCRVSAQCTKYLETIEKETGLEISKANLFELPEVAELTDQQRAALCLYKSSIESLLKNCKEYVINRHLNNDPVEGIKVVEGVARRKWRDTGTVEATLKKMGFSDEDIFNRKLKGIGELERLAGKKTVKNLAIKGKPSLTIVDMDDDREPVKNFLDYLK